MTACLVTALSSPAAATPLSREPWRVIYQVYVRAFYDGSPTPDGEGDLAGLEAKAGYLSDLGISAVLLMPVFASTGGMGYIPKDYLRLDPAYGDEAALRSLVQTLHARGIKVILDVPLNHISWDSPWFLRASQKNCDPSDAAYDPGDPSGRYCDFFYFSGDPCRELPFARWHKPWDYARTDCDAVWFRRPEFNPAYHRPERFYATFSRGMPDLKFWDFSRDTWNEPVVEAVQAALDHWAALGVDAFRIDAAKHFVEGTESNADPREPQNLALLGRLLSGVRRVAPDTSFVGEIWSGYDQIEPYLSGALDAALDFPFMEAVRDSVRDGYGEPLKGVLRHLASRQGTIGPGQRVVFAGNHDVSRMMTAWHDDDERLRLAHFLTFLTPFTPLLFYGEELGLHGAVKRPDDTSPEEFVRTDRAFPWEGGPTGGFPGSRPPVVGVADNADARNLARATADPDSSLALVKKLTALRRGFGVSEATRLVVRDDLYGHTLGWTLVDGARCLTVLVNFHEQDTYTVRAAHADPACGSRVVEALAARAELTAGGYALGPRSRVAFSNGP